MSQKLVYEVIIDDEICHIKGLHDALDELIGDAVECVVIGSRLESDDEVSENGNI